MCGIAGIFDFAGAPVDRDLLGQMIQTLRHRGPDDAGVFTDGALGLAHARLSILDLQCGRQPMSNPERTLWISFNGEIFNYLELREELLGKGYKFSTRSDTEVLLQLYADKGEDCVHHLNGQWAFAIWDARRRTLFLSRDRLGVRPLFYTLAGRAFLFASEIKALLAFPGIQRELDLQALSQVFTFWFTLPPRTAFRGISELPPGHSLTVKDGRLDVRRYWQLDFLPSCPPAAEVARQEGRYAEQLQALLEDATRLRLRSDVPVGAYLSGGLDSTVTTALIQRVSNAPLKTFSVRFEDPEFDESNYQDEAIRFLHTDHQEIRCSTQDIGRIFPEVIWHAEKPILRTAPAPLYLLSRLVRESGYKVVLTGEGSDEILGGYDIYKEAKVRRFCAAQPHSQVRPLLLKRLYPYLPNIQAQSPAFLKAFFGLGGTADQLFFSHRPRWDLTAKLQLFFSDEVKSQLRSHDVEKDMEAVLPANYKDWHWFCQAQYLETAHLLPGYILSSQGDRVAMAHSVEGRFPFLDYRVVEFATTIPPILKMKVLNEKYLLKKCVQGLVPDMVRKRHKQPYRAPEGKSFFKVPGRKADYVEELLSAERLQDQGVFAPAAVGKLVDKFRRGQAIGIRDNMALVGILSTQLLVQQFITDFAKGRARASDSPGIASVHHR